MKDLLLISLLAAAGAASAPASPSFCEMRSVELQTAIKTYQAYLSETCGVEAAAEIFADCVRADHNGSNGRTVVMNMKDSRGVNVRTLVDMQTQDASILAPLSCQDSTDAGLCAEEIYCSGAVVAEPVEEAKKSPMDFGIDLLESEPVPEIVATRVAKVVALRSLWTKTFHAAQSDASNATAEAFESAPIHAIPTEAADAAMALFEALVDSPLLTLDAEGELALPALLQAAPQLAFMRHISLASALAFNSGNTKIFTGMANQIASTEKTNKGPSLAEVPISEWATVLPATYNPRVHKRPSPMSPDVSACFAPSLVLDQGACGSCWAFAIASNISSRTCVQQGNPQKGLLASPQSVMACATDLIDQSRKGKPILRPCDGAALISPLSNGGVALLNQVPYGFKCHVSGADPSSVNQNTGKGEWKNALNAAVPSSCNRQKANNESTQECNCTKQSTAYPKCGADGKKNHFNVHNDVQYTGLATTNPAIIKVADTYKKAQILVGGSILTGVCTHPFFNQFANNGNFVDGGIFGYKDGAITKNFCANYGHAVITVGWGADSKGKEYWIMQNSWAASFGDVGFFRVYMDDPFFRSVGNADFSFNYSVKPFTPVPAASSRGAYPRLPSAARINPDGFEITELEGGRKLVGFLTNCNDNIACAMSPWQPGRFPFVAALMTNGGVQIPFEMAGRNVAKSAQGAYIYSDTVQYNLARPGPESQSTQPRVVVDTQTASDITVALSFSVPPAASITKAVQAEQEFKACQKARGAKWNNSKYVDLKAACGDFAGCTSATKQSLSNLKGFCDWKAASDKEWAVLGNGGLKLEAAMEDEEEDVVFTSETAPATPVEILADGSEVYQTEAFGRVVRRNWDAVQVEEEQEIRM